MRKPLLTLAAIFLFAAPALAQRTIVTGTVVDPATIPYAGATLIATLSLPVGASGATLNGVQISGATQRVTLDSTGSFLMQLPDNNVVQPPGTQWTFTITMSPGVPPPIGTGPQTFSATVTITAASQSVSTQLNAVAPRLAVIPTTQQPQIVSSTAFASGTIPTGVTGTLILFATPTAFTLSGPSCSSCDGQRLTIFVFPTTGPYTISGTLGVPTFYTPFFGPADKLTFSSAAGSAATFEYRNGTLFYTGGNGFIPSFNGSAGPPVGAAVQDFYLNVTADGSLNFVGPNTPYGSAFITKGSAAVLTLTNPVAGTQDGFTLTVMSTTAFAHTITTGTNGINGSLHIATFGAAVGNFIVFKAFNGSWWVVGNTGVVLT